MKEIQLSHGMTALVDDEDYEYLIKIKWYAVYHKNVSSYRPRMSNGQFMHRIIMNSQPGDVVDHINHNTLDNRKENLRHCTKSQNMFNKSGNKNRNLPKGVSLHNGKYRARITIYRKNIELGAFETPEEAANAYDVAAREYFGEFAKTNYD